MKNDLRKYLFVHQVRVGAGIVPRVERVEPQHVLRIVKQFFLFLMVSLLQ